MDWTMFWITAAVVVGILIILAQIASVRAWAGRVFGRVLPNFGGWSLPVLSLASLGTKAWVRLAAIPLVIGAILFVINYVEGRGADKVRVEVAEQNTVNVERQARAQVNLERDTRDRIEASVEQEYEILEELGHVEREIMEADGVDAIAAAHAAAVERLRQLAASSHAAAISGAAPAAGS